MRVEHSPPFTTALLTSPVMCIPLVPICLIPGEKKVLRNSIDLSTSPFRHTTGVQTALSAVLPGTFLDSGAGGFACKGVLLLTGAQTKKREVLICGQPIKLSRSIIGRAIVYFNTSNICLC